MTDAEAKQIVRMIVTNWPAHPFPRDQLELFRLALVPLPFGFCHERIRGALQAQDTAAPTLAALLDWLALEAPGALELHRRAIAEGFALARDVCEPIGWRRADRPPRWIPPAAEPAAVAAPRWLPPSDDPPGPSALAGPTIPGGVRLMLAEKRAAEMRQRVKELAAAFAADRAATPPPRPAPLPPD